MSLEAGETITVIAQDESGWWEGRSGDKVRPFSFSLSNIFHFTN